MNKIDEIKQGVKARKLPSSIVEIYEMFLYLIGEVEHARQRAEEAWKNEDALEQENEALRKALEEIRDSQFEATGWAKDIARQALGNACEHCGEYQAYCNQCV